MNIGRTYMMAWHGMGRKASEYVESCLSIDVKGSLRKSNNKTVPMILRYQQTQHLSKKGKECNNK